MSRIKESNCGYSIAHKFKSNLYKEEFIEKEFQLPQMAYMDDTTWIGLTKTNLEKILTIANSFYKLNQIQINKEKSRLMLSNAAKQTCTDDIIRINYGDKVLVITPVNQKESIRILGIWFNMKKDRKYNIQQTREEITNYIRNIKFKSLTNKQITYVYNMVIIPRIEYKLQLTHITRSELNNISSKFQIAFKYKLNLNRAAPNALMNIHKIYGIKNL